MRKEKEKTEKSLQTYAELNKTLEKELKPKQEGNLARNSYVPTIQVRRQSRYGSPQNRNDSFGNNGRNNSNEGRESIRKSFLSKNNMNKGSLNHFHELMKQPGRLNLCIMINNKL